jgi:hypothetical protein
MIRLYYHKNIDVIVIAGKTPPFSGVNACIGNTEAVASLFGEGDTQGVMDRLLREGTDRVHNRLIEGE